MKCVACGSAALVSGVVNQEGTGGIVFRPDDLPVLKSMFGIGTRKVRAYGCAHCGHLQMMVEFTDEDRKRYQQFEGEQPSVLERLNRE